MLSLSRVTTGQASTYYTADDYYLQDKGEWSGNLTQTLGVSGIIQEKDFQAFISGRDINNRFKIQSGGKEYLHSAGLDLTFSAPKSVSIVGTVLEDKAVLQAHEKAVNHVLDLIEKEYTGVRVKVKGEVGHEKTGNALIAKFQHVSSRELDPQLHTHCLMMNFSQKDNGDMRAMDFKEVYNNKMYFGQLYRSELAMNLKELGYNIVADGKGFFEIEGIPDSLLKEFSKRTEQINAKYEELKLKHPNVSHSELRQMATLDSRKTKDEPTLSELLKDWNDTLEKHGCSKEELKKELLSNHVAELADIKSDIINKALQDSIKILTEHEAVIKQEQILEVACKLTVGMFRENELKEKIPQVENLIKLDENIYTTKEIYNMERNIVKAIVDGKNQFQKVLNKDYINKNIVYYEVRNDFKLTSGQKNAVSHILNSPDRIIAIQGDAGTGKTTMLDVVRTIAEKDKKEIIGLSFTGKAASEIEEASKIKSSTIASFLSKDENLHGKIVVIDEASMLSIKDTHSILNRCDDNTKLVLIGDTKQLQAIGQGKIFATLQEKNIISTVRMSEIQRQTNAAYKEVVENLSNKQVVKAIEKLDLQDRILQINDRDNRLNKVVEEYLKNPKSSIIVTAANIDREEINKRIRSKLQSAKNIDSKEHKFFIKETKSLKGEEKAYAYSYSLGDLIIANKNGILGNAGAEGKIIQIDYKHRVIQVKSNGKTYKVDLKNDGHGLQVYTQKHTPFANGEKILFLKNDNFLNVKNGQTATIKSIARNGNVNLLMDNGQKLIINLKKDYSYISHGYALTDYKSQGQTANHVIFHVDTTKKVNYNQTYVGITRGKESVVVITDDKQIFKDRAQQEQTKTSTLDYNIETSIGIVTNDKISLKNTVQHEQIKANISSSDIKAVYKSEYSTKKQSVNFKTVETLYWEANKISEQLSNNVERVLNDMGYSKLTRASNQYRVGKKGSLAFTYAGPKKGYWNDFETGEGGKSLISFIQRERGLDFKEALDYSASLLGLGEFDKTREVKIFVVNESKPDISFDEYQLKMIKVAQSIAERTSTAKGTMVEDYLKSRGITAQLPSSISFNEKVYVKKYDKSFPAMVVKLHDEKGVVQSIHLTLLENGQKAAVENAKLKFGPVPNNVAVDLNTTKPTKDITLVAEGLETALSLKSAFPNYDVKATLEKGGFNRLDIDNTSKDIVLCLDNDLKNWKDDKVITNAINRLHEAGKTVWVAYPNSINNQKTDFNDILCNKGVVEVKHTVLNAERCNSFEKEETHSKILGKSHGIER